MFNSVNFYKICVQRICNQKTVYKYSTLSTNPEQWDVIISGGGMVGCAMACSLGNSDILANQKILLLESSSTIDYNIAPDKYSNRVSAISPGSKLLFDNLGIWQKIARFKEVKKLQVWESCSDARVSFQDPSMVNEIAYIIENNAILNALNERLRELESRVKVLRGAMAIHYSFSSDKSQEVVVELKDGQILKTKLLIGADGIKSTVRQTMGVKYTSLDYKQKGIVATLKLSEPTDNVVAWQRFLPSGPIALLPLTDDLSSLVWTVSFPVAEKLRGLSDENFVDALNSSLWDNKNKSIFVDSAVSRFKSFLNSFASDYVIQSIHQLPPSVLSVDPNSRAEFPLGLGHAAQYVRPQAALIGDAAHRVHPLAGQGVNLGFGDVKCLTEKLEKSIYDGNCIDYFGSLLEYETERQRCIVPTMAVIDGLNRLYKSQFTPIVLLRSLGLTMVDSFGLFKNQMIKHAST